jgi:hypothetical protein
MTFPALPGTSDGFTLLGFEPESFLLLGWMSPNGTPITTWAFVLDEAAHNSARPLVRLMHFIMERKQLIGIATRAEMQSASGVVKVPRRADARRDAA